jgi:hypothetical protein
VTGLDGTGDTVRRRKEGRVAIIGAGLAGLSAAYHLPRTVRVTIFERNRVIGGRVRTATAFGAEEGAEFLVGSEKEIRRLTEKVGVRCDEIHDWSSFCFGGRWGSGSFRTVAWGVLPRRSAKRVSELLALAPHYARYGGLRADRWLRRKLGGDGEAMSFIKVILAGETCAPLDHVDARFLLGCLCNDRWYRIHGGSQRLVSALFSNRQPSLKLRARVHSVRETRAGVTVRWIGPRGRQQETFDGSIIATPNGERLAGSKVRRHFHSYLNVLLKYRRAWWGEESQSVRRAFATGFYTDGPLNYVQQAAKTGPGSRTLRILLPHADRQLGWSRRRIEETCVLHLREISPLAERPIRSLVTRWPEGLPCGGREEKRKQIGRRVHLAGDRFGEWPSMNAAIVSGRQVARLLSTRLR